MKTEAETNAEADKKVRESADKLNSADSLVFQTEKQLSDYGDKIPEDKKSAIETSLAELKEAHKAQDIDKIDTAMAALNAAWQTASQDIYQAQQDAGANGATADAGGAGDATQDGTDSAGATEDVTDVEYEEVEDK